MNSVFVSTVCPSAVPMAARKLLPLPERFVSDWLRIDTLNSSPMGALSGATAAVDIPYKVTNNTGVLRFETRELRELMWEAHASGFRISTHAIGDVAIEQVLEHLQIAHNHLLRPTCVTASSILVYRTPTISPAVQRLASSLLPKQFSYLH
ncbi:MAG: hypothetical protein R3E39_13910 [Anaerolineae bacterium]